MLPRVASVRRALAAFALGGLLAGPLALVGAGAAHAADGDLDLTFSTDGIVLADAGTASSSARSVVVQPDGRIVVLASAESTGRAVWAFVRFTSAGALDPTFGTGGRVLLPVGTGDAFAASMVRRPDGKLVAAGSVDVSGTATHFGVAQLNADGTLDTSFGTGGVAINAAGGTFATAAGVALQADGKVVVAGSVTVGSDTQFVVQRLRTDGAVDTAFGSSGNTVVDISAGIDFATAVVVQTDGRIIVVGDDDDGTTDADAVAMRLTSDGVLDTTYGTNGIVNASTSVTDDFAANAVLQADGKLVLSVATSVGAQARIAAVRLGTDGTPDDTFGTDGTIILAQEIGTFPRGIARQSDGKIVLAGERSSGGGTGFGVARLTVDGVLDSTFGTNGSVLTPIQTSDAANAVTIGGDATIVVAGQSSDGSNQSIAVARYQASFQGVVTSSPSRVLDTRGGTKPTAGSLTRVATGAPAGTRAVLVNLTVTGAEAPGYITADRCSLMSASPQSKSNANYQAGEDIANTAVVNIDSDGSFCIYTDQKAHLLADMQGSYRIGGLRFTAVTPSRVLDSRFGTKPAAGSITRVPTGAPAGTSAVLVNLTITGAEGVGYVTADRCSVLVAGPQARSNANFGPARDIANSAVVNVDTDGAFCIYASAPTHLLADLQGTYQNLSGVDLTSVTPSRLLNTRTGAKPAAGSITRVVTGVPAGVTAVLVNLTVTGATSPGYITADKCSTLVAGPQSKSNANYQAGRDIANASVVNVDADGAFCIYADQSVHLLADLQGYYRP